MPVFRWKGGIFRSGQKIKGLRGGLLLCAAQAKPQIDTARAEKDSFHLKLWYAEYLMDLEA
jgi:hypothetical protein